MRENDVTNKYAEEREALIAAGVPPHVADYALSQSPAQWIYAAGAWSVFVVMLGGFGIGAWAWQFLEAAVEHAVLIGAVSLGAVLYWTNFGLSPSIALFGWIFAAGLITYALFSSTARLRASTFVYSFLDPKNAAYARAFTPFLRLADESDPDRYIRCVIGSWTRIALWGALIMFALAGYALERELRTYTAYTPEGYVAKPLLPWEKDEANSWAQAQAVELGCNHVTGKNASDDVIYRVTLEHGSSQSLGDVQPVEGSWLDQIEIIDAALRDANVPFRRWEWLKRDPLHPACLEAQRAKYGAEGAARLNRLLRVGEFPGDAAD